MTPGKAEKPIWISVGIIYVLLGIMAFAFPQTKVSAVYIVIVVPVLMLVVSAIYAWRLNDVQAAPKPLLAALSLHLVAALWLQAAVYEPCGSLPTTAQPNCLPMPGGWGLMVARIDAHGMFNLWFMPLGYVCLGYLMGSAARQMQRRARMNA